MDRPFPFRNALLPVSFKDWTPHEPFTWCPYHRLGLYQLPTLGHALQHYTASLIVPNNLVYYEFICLPLTLLLTQKSPGASSH